MHTDKFIEKLEIKQCFYCMNNIKEKMSAGYFRNGCKWHRMMVASMYRRESFPRDVIDKQAISCSKFKRGKK